MKEMTTNYLKAYIEYRQMIIKNINDEIIENGFRPNKLQQTQINLFCHQGREALEELERRKTMND